MRNRVPVARRSRLATFAVTFALVAQGFRPTTAAEAKSKKTPPEPPAKLSLEPAKFEFSNPRTTLQLVASGAYGGDRVRDLTADVKLTSSDPKIARIRGTTVIPVSDGTAKITAKIGERAATAEVVV